MTFDGRWEAYFTIPVGGAAMSVTNSGGGPTAVTVPAGTYGPSSLVAAVLAQLTATCAPSSGAWTATLSTGPTGTGKVTLNCTGAWSITWTSATLQAVLGFTAGNIVGAVAAVTGASQMRGLWIPDCPLTITGDPGRAPRPTDFRATLSPTGRSYALIGNAYYRHAGLAYDNVQRSKIWASQAAIANAAWETFLQDVQLGLGSISWFSVGSAVQIWDHNGVQLGIDANGGTGLANGWNFPDVLGLSDKFLKPSASSPQWVGLWALQIGQLTSEA